MTDFFALFILIKIYINIGGKMKAEIISVGTELLLGHTINTDASFIARALAELGVDLRRVQTVGDNPIRLENALGEALSESDIVITSGGLGPTEDDLTKECAAKIAGVPLEESPECLAALREYFGDRPLSANQYKQALIPRGAIIFKNRHGTAPGCAIPCPGGKYICILPGPPAELLPMLETGLIPFLKTFSRQIIKSAILNCFGIGEGAAAEKLGELVQMANPTVATYAGDCEIMVKITAKAESREKADELIEPVKARVRECLGDRIYGEDAGSLEQKVVTLLKEKGLQIGSAESCTGGLLAARITDQPGASEVFHLGVIAYANEAKERILHVSKETLARYGAVSPQTAAEMALGIKELAAADFGVAITGIAGPGGGTPEKPVGLVYIALAGKEIHINKMEPSGRYMGRAWVRRRASSAALDMLRRALTGLPVCIKL